jgi:hypothetical protein
LQDGGVEQDGDVVEAQDARLDRRALPALHRAQLLVRQARELE